MSPATAMAAPRARLARLANKTRSHTVQGRLASSLSLPLSLSTVVGSPSARAGTPEGGGLALVQIVRHPGEVPLLVSRLLFVQERQQGPPDVGFLGNLVDFTVTLITSHVVERNVRCACTVRRDRPRIVRRDQWCMRVVACCAILVNHHPANRKEGTKNHPQADRGSTLARPAGYYLRGLESMWRRQLRFMKIPIWSNIG